MEYYILNADHWEESRRRIGVPEGCTVDFYNRQFTVRRETGKYDSELVFTTTADSAIKEESDVTIERYRYVEDEKAAEKCREACEEIKGEYQWVDAAKK